MSRVHFLVLIAFTAGLLTASLAVSARPAQDRVEIRTDQAKGVVRIVIDGKVMARIDKSGFHTNGDLGYAGVLVDTGVVNDAR